MDFVDVVFLLSRLLVAFLLIGSGVGHFMQTQAMAGYAEAKGLPSGALMVQISGGALLAGGVSIALGILGDIGALGSAILLVVIAVTMHAFWNESDPTAKQTEMVAFNKNVAIAGGLLSLWILFASLGQYGGLTMIDTGWGWGF